VSGLWTPSGEHSPSDGDERGATLGATADEQPAVSEEERAAAEAELARIQEELASTPVADIIANHAIGLWQLAVLHLSRDDRDLEEAKLAIDAFAALVEGLGARLGENQAALRDALAQVQLAYVQVSGTPDAG